MTTAPDGAPRRPLATPSAAHSRRSAGETGPFAAGAPRRPSTTTGPAAPPAKTAPARPAGGSRRDRLVARLRRGGPAIASILIPIVVLPFSFFIWYVIISLGGYPGDRAGRDLVVALLLTALVHAVLLVGILMGVRAVRARKTAGGVSVAGWIGIVLGALVILFWELLVSPWLVELWNRVVA